MLAMALPAMNNGTAGTMHRPKKSLMNMAFYWGSYGTVLFRQFPGFRTDTYVLSLVGTFLVSFLVEWPSHCRLIKPCSDPILAGLAQTLMQGLGVGLAYLLMLTSMSFNGGVFLVAVAAHAQGFFILGGTAFEKTSYPENASDLPPMSC